MSTTTTLVLDKRGFPVKQDRVFVSRSTKRGTSLGAYAEHYSQDCNEWRTAHQLLLPANAGFISLCSLLIHTMNNPYIQQIMAQEGMTYLEASREARKSARPITLQYAQSQGFATVEAYEEALHDFLNGN